MQRWWPNLIVLGAVAAWLALGGTTLGDTRKSTPTPPEVNRAAHALEAGNIKEAVQILNKLLSADPNQPELLNMLGIARGKEGDAVESEKLFQRAAYLNPKFAPAYINLGELYKREKRSDKALAAYEKAAAIEPRDPQVLYNLAVLHAEKREYKPAIAEMESIPSPARPPDYWSVLSQLYISDGNNAAAEEALQQSLKQHPDSVETLRHLAGLALKRGDPVHALNYLARARQAAPNSPELLYEFAQVSLQNHLAKEAALAMRKAILLDSSRPEFLLELGNALLETSDYQEALKYFQQYVDQKPDDPAGQVNLGWSYYLNHDNKNARQHFEECLRLDPNQVDAEYHLGMIAYDQGDDADATKWLSRVVESRPQDARGYWGMGLVNTREQKYPQALQEFQVSARLNPDEPKVHYQLSQIYTRLGHLDDAQSELQQYRLAQKKQEEQVNLGQSMPFSPSSARQ